MASQDSIKVSVCVVTYNQEKYIAECLQSLVDQVTSFNFEILVSDDCSTDSTPLIIDDFFKRYPRKIKSIAHKENIGAFKNFLFVHQQAKGQYIAHMDGDDYALPDKLQNQADFLDAHEDCNIVWHPVVKVDSEGNYTPPLDSHSNAVFEKKFNRFDVIKYGAIGVNSSKMYRSCVRDFTAPGFDVIDYFANVEQVGNGYAAFSSKEPLGVYRLGIGIASSGIKTRSLLIRSALYFLRK